MIAIQHLAGIVSSELKRHNNESSSKVDGLKELSMVNSKLMEEKPNRSFQFYCQVTHNALNEAFL